MVLFRAKALMLAVISLTPDLSLGLQQKPLFIKDFSPSIEILPKYL